ncbi:hypothetical protein E1160_01415 [Rhodospirillaceae bacterium RKSG073]|nr:hypothetical protein [Curvivirga aplysinae]
MGKTLLDPFVPVIVTQSKADLSLLVNEQRAGVDFSILKPFSLNEILSHLDHIMRHRRRFMISKEYIGPYRGSVKKHVKKNAGLLRLVPNRLRLRKAHANFVSDVESLKNEWLKLIETEISH